MVRPAQCSCAVSAPSRMSREAGKDVKAQPKPVARIGKQAVKIEVLHQRYRL